MARTPKKNTRNKDKGDVGTKKTDVKRRKTGPGKRSNIEDEFCTIPKELDLLNKLIEPEQKKGTIVSNWIDLFKTDPEEAVYQLLGVISLLGGSIMVPSKSAISKEVEIVKVIDVLEDNVQNENNKLPDSLEIKEPKKIKKKLLNFFNQLFTKGLYEIFDESTLLNLLQHFLVNMSNSQFRSFRQLATSLSLNIMTNIVNACQTLNDVRVASIKQNTKKRTPKSKQKNIVSQETANSEHIDLLKSALNELFDEVFVHRYRDVDSGIRTECIKELGVWVSKYPEHFLNNSYISYLGWQLSDKVASVRTESLNSIAQQMKVGNDISELRAFIDNFKPRIIEMALKDVDTTVKCNAINLLGLIYQHGLLESTEKDGLIELLFHEDKKVRKSIAPFIKIIIDNELLPDMVRKLFKSDISKLSEIEKVKVEIKCLISIFKDFNPAYKNEEELIDFRVRDLISVIDGFLKASKDLDPAENLTLLSVKSLWDHLSFLKDWKALLELVEQDNHAKKSNSKLVFINESEEPILLIIFNAVIEMLKEENANLEANEAKLGKNLADEPTQYLKLRAYLLQEAQPFENLISKFSDNKDSLISVLKSIELSLCGEAFLESNKMKAFEKILTQLQKVFSNHSDPGVVYQAMKVIKTLGHFPSSPPHEFIMFRDVLVEDVLTSLKIQESKETTLSALQHLRALLMLTSWGLSIIHSRNSTIIENLFELCRSGFQEGYQLMDLMILVASLDILYRIFLWDCGAIVRQTNEAQRIAEARKTNDESGFSLVDESEEEKINKDLETMLANLSSFRNKLVKICYKIVYAPNQHPDPNFEDDYFIYIRRFAFVLLNDTVWLEKPFYKYNKGGAIKPSIMELELGMVGFLQLTLDKLETYLVQQNEELNIEDETERRILRKPLLRQTFLHIESAVIRSVLLGVFSLNALRQIVTKYGRLDPVMDESVKIIMNQAIRPRLKNAKALNVANDTCKFLEDCIREAFKLAKTTLKDNEPTYKPLVALTKICMTCLKPIKFRNQLISKRIAEFHKEFILATVNEINSSEIDLTKLEDQLTTLRLLVIMVKDNLVEPQISEVRNFLVDNFSKLKPDKDASEWDVYFYYLRVLDENINVLSGTQPTSIQVESGAQPEISAIIPGTALPPIQETEGLLDETSIIKETRDMDVTHITTLNEMEMGTQDMNKRVTQMLDWEDNSFEQSNIGASQNTIMLTQNTELQEGEEEN